MWGSGFEFRDKILLIVKPELCGNLLKICIKIIKHIKTFSGNFREMQIEIGKLSFFARDEGDK